MSEIKFDLHYGKWLLPEARAFASAIGKMPGAAIGDVSNVVRRAVAERIDRFGDEAPPEGWTPDAWMTFDVDLMAAFAWIVARRADPALTFAAYSETLVYGELLAAFLVAVASLFGDEADEDPLSSGEATQSDSSSAPSSPGDSTTATS